MFLTVHWREYHSNWCWFIHVFYLLFANKLFICTERHRDCNWKSAFWTLTHAAAGCISLLNDLKTFTGQNWNQRLWKTSRFFVSGGEPCDVWVMSLESALENQSVWIWEEDLTRPPRPAPHVCRSLGSGSVSNVIKQELSPSSSVCVFFLHCSCI